jgi:hypothetical protein
MGLIDKIKMYKPIIGMAVIQTPVISVPFIAQYAMDKGLGDLVAAGIMVSGLMLLPLGWLYASVTAMKMSQDYDGRI